MDSTHTNDIALQFAKYFPAESQPYFYLLWKKFQDGHICFHRDELKSEMVKSVYTNFDVSKTNEAEFISRNPEEIKPIIEQNGLLYLHRNFYYETIIYNKINELCNEENSVNIDLEKVAKIFDRDFLTADGEVDWQMIAAVASIKNNFTIITGGPGTGKTTTVATILQILIEDNPKSKVALAAPTGKAAARMAESLKARTENFSEELKNRFNEFVPLTIHRLLGSQKDSIHFNHNHQNPLDYDIIIIDESSMIDVALFAKFLDAVRPSTKLILLGDKNQLASVEAGSLFGDLCNVPLELNTFSSSFCKLLSNKIQLKNATTLSPLSDHIIELQKSYRFNADAGIGKISKIILDGNKEQLKSFINENDSVVEVNLNHDIAKFNEFIQGFESYIQEEDIAKAIDKLNDCRVLCAMREGNFGIYKTNQRIEIYLEEKQLITRNKKFYENRPVIITKNDYQLGLFNGDTGLVRMDSETEELRVWFNIQGELKSFHPAMISTEETCFAITIHKSQGSEFNNVLVYLPDYEVQVLTKELVYTAVTRAKDYVLIQGEEETFVNSIGISVKRGSGLKQRFTNN